MSSAEKLQIVGKITTAFGVKGWVRVYSFTDNAEDIFKYSPWKINSRDGWKTVKVISWRSMSKGLVAQIEGCDDRDAAFALRQTDIGVELEQFKKLEDGDYYWKDLMGCRLENLQQQDLGVVTKFMETGANDVLVVDIDEQAIELKNSKGKQLKERLVPYLYDHVIIRVELESKKIIVDWPSDF